MITAFRYRIYPSADQEARLLQWEGALRFLWNLAHEQRLHGLERCGFDKRFPSVNDQCKELTLLRAEFPWLEEVMRDASDSVLIRLQDAWSDFFSGKADMPQFKKKGIDTVSIEAKDKKSFYFSQKSGKTFLVFPKIGHLDIVLHRPCLGKLKKATLIREVDQWFVSITCEVDVKEPPTPPSGGTVAIDRGVIVALADSNDQRVDNPRLGQAMAPTLAKRKRQASKKQKGSKNRTKANVKVAKVYRKLRRQRENFQHTYSYRYAKKHSVIVIEDLQLKNMTKSAKGTEEEPGKNVAQKAGLNRELQDVAMGRFGVMLGYKCPRFGGVLVKETAAYSSQDCLPPCNHRAEENRPTRDLFKCVKCGHEDHADNHAAKVLLERYNRRTGGEAACGGTLMGGPMKQEPRSVRKRTSFKKKRGPQSLALHGEDGLPSIVGRSKENDLAPGRLLRSLPPRQDAYF